MFDRDSCSGQECCFSRVVLIVLLSSIANTNTVTGFQIKLLLLGLLHVSLMSLELLNYSKMKSTEVYI